MTSFEVLVSKTALKQFKSLDAQSRKRIKKAFNCLTSNPFVKRAFCDIKQLKIKSTHSFFRLRVGNYRMVYTVIKKKVKITEILHRKKVYKFLD